jgi:hypothetical protein
MIEQTTPPSRIRSLTEEGKVKSLHIPVMYVSGHKHNRVFCLSDFLTMHLGWSQIFLIDREFVVYFPHIILDLEQIP